MSEPVYYKSVKMPGIYRGGAGERGWKRGVDDAHAKMELDKRLADAVKLVELQAEARERLSFVIFPHDFIVDDDGDFTFSDGDDSRVVLDTDKLETFAKKTVFDGLREQDALHQQAVNLTQRDPSDYTRQRDEPGDVSGTKRYPSGDGS